ncbi:Thioredoxin [Paenibacillus sp. UNCCL117]|uniref:thioredoxin family protein n=1 Tax=unclassified Paenibacillus TaxID=185978 RepID=UPI000884432F|nr:MULTISPECIES: thioredoxin family protein [unclassified Paenibacillus]SDC23510.1 Thioredoxin [Paenibacillus sp. cl123]SFW19312.1 Thioredoxin [Paenibacillus sp. UNCCL117]
MKKLAIYLSVILVLFGALFVINQQSNKAKYSKYENNVYGIAPEKLNPETLKQLDDPNYQNIILPEALDQKIEKKESFFLYYFASTCVHCKATTPILMPAAKSLGVDIKQFNLEEFRNGWDRYKIEATPTLIYYKEGKEVERLVGEQTDAAIKAFLSKHKA